MSEHRPLPLWAGRAAALVGIVLVALTLRQAVAAISPILGDIRVDIPISDIGVGLRTFIERKSAPIDLLVIVTDCHTPWPEDVPPFPVITIRVGDGAAPPWGNRGANKVITIEEPSAGPTVIGPRRG